MKTEPGARPSPACTRFLLALLGLALTAAPGWARAPSSEAEKLRDALLDATLDLRRRVKAADSLSRVDPEMLGNALFSMEGPRKDPHHLPFLVAYTVQEEVPHLRMVAVHAAWITDPEKVMDAYFEKAEASEEKEAIRAIHAIGMLAPVLKDRAAYPRLLKIAGGSRVYPGVEAADAVARAGDRRLLKDLLDAAITVPDDHVRKHVVWGIQDLEEKRKAIKMLEVQKRRPGKEGKNANEGVEILLDEGANPFAWDPMALKGIKDWWEKDRPKNGEVGIAIGDEETKEKVKTWFTELEKTAPAWRHFVGSTLRSISIRTQQSPDIFDAKKRVLGIDATEITRCETPWQGSYVVTRDACIAFRAITGAPQAGHRGWEPAYVDIHSFYKTTKHAPGSLTEFVDRAVSGKPWPL